MATISFYVYKLQNNFDPSYPLKELFGDALEILVKIKDHKLIYTYSVEDGLIYPYRIPDVYLDQCVTPLPALDFVNRMGGASIFITTSKPVSSPQGLDLVETRRILDYSKMIDDLERIGKIKTKPSKGYMSIDPRKFWFMGDSQEYEVDCLGTSLCGYISDRVVDEWSSCFENRYNS
jgi:hypothetical protein